MLKKYASIDGTTPQLYLLSKRVHQQLEISVCFFFDFDMSRSPNIEHDLKIGALHLCGLKTKAINQGISKVLRHELVTLKLG